MGAHAVPPDILRWLLAISFFAVAAWALKPDKLDEDDAAAATRWGVFGVTTVAFFLAEIGDKTQIATVMLAAQFDSLAAVVIGTTLGMMVVNVPTVFVGAPPRRAFRSAPCASPPPRCSPALGVWVLLAPT